MRIATTAFAAAFLATASAGAYELPGHPSCPQATAETSWRDFVANSPALRQGRDTFFNVRFTNAKRLGDNSRKQDGPFGDVFAGSCYTVSYNQSGNWSASGYSKAVQGGALRVTTGGDPLRYELNVSGQRFTFNEKGEVHSKEHGLVGELFCPLSDQCGGFGDKLPDKDGEPLRWAMLGGISWKTPLGGKDALIPKAAHDAGFKDVTTKTPLGGDGALIPKAANDMGLKDVSWGKPTGGRNSEASKAVRGVKRSIKKL